MGSIAVLCRSPACSAWTKCPPSWACSVGQGTPRTGTGHQPLPVTELHSLGCLPRASQLLPRPTHMLGPPGSPECPVGSLLVHIHWHCCVSFTENSGDQLRPLRPGAAHPGLSRSNSAPTFRMEHALVRGGRQALPSLPLEPSGRFARAPEYLPQKSLSHPHVSDGCIWSLEPLLQRASGGKNPLTLN